MIYYIVIDSTDTVVYSFTNEEKAIRYLKDLNRLAGYTRYVLEYI